MAENLKIMPERPQFHKPQINLARSSAGRMWLVSLCAIMAIFQSSLTDSFSSFAIAIAAVIAAVLTEFIIIDKNRRFSALKDGSAVASALVLTLLLPNRISPFYAAAGAVFAMAVIKHSFGGLGSNWINPAAGGWLFIRFSWPAAFNRALEGSPLSILADSLSRSVSNIQGSPLGILKIEAANLFSSASPMDTSIRSLLNRTVFSLFGAELPGGYLDLFSSPFPGIIADRGILALLLGTIIITAARASRSWIPALYLAVISILYRIAGALPYGGVLWDGDVIFALCSGGTLTAAFILAADPASGAKSNAGIFVAVILGAGLSFLFRCFGSEPYGAVYAALFINAIMPLIRVCENRKLLRIPGGINE